MKCKFGYYEHVKRCDWQPVNAETGACSEICQPLEHKKLVQAQKRINKVRHVLGKTIIGE